MGGPVLGIETSCDETAAAVVADGAVRSNVVFTQTDHGRFGGVVPEIASRNHVRELVPVLREALASAGARMQDLSGVAVTCGPGLVGCLLVGVSVAKGLAWAHGLPLLGVHHIEGHLWSGYLEHPDLEPPFVALVASGGHTDLVSCPAPGRYAVCGSTLDDAAGEAFDKVAKMLGILRDGEPTMGGPRLSALAETGDERAFAFPRGLPDERLAFSFSGLKTAVLYRIRGWGAEELEARKADVAASFQAAAVSALVEKTFVAVQRLKARRLLVAGGVAANRRLRKEMAERAALAGVRLYVPSPPLCTDNAAMVAAVGEFRLGRGERSGLDLNAVPRMPLPGLCASASDPPCLSST